MHRTSYFYWLLAEAVMGFGYLLLFEGGVLLVLLGMGLALWRVARTGGRRFGGTLTLPSASLLRDADYPIARILHL